MGRGVHKHKKEQMQVKSFRLGEDDINAIKIFMGEEDCDQSTALRLLIQYGILHYTMNVIDSE